MKKIITFCLLLLTFACIGCGSNEKKADNTSAQPTQPAATAPAAPKGDTPMPNNKKILVAYYSWSSNTKAVAEEIHKQVGGDLVEILPETPYSETYAITVAKAKQEQLSGARPAVKTKITNMAEYGTVYLGYPNWWGSMPMHIATFVESYDFSGKKVIPFFTHGGGGIQNCEKDLKARAKGATFAEPLVLSGNTAKSSQGEITAWLKKVQ